MSTIDQSISKRLLFAIILTAACPWKTLLRLAPC